MRSLWMMSIGLLLSWLSQSAQADTVVLDARLSSDAGDDVAELLAPLTQELESRGARLATRALTKSLEGSGSRPSRMGKGLRTDFVEAVDRGYKQWISGNFSECVAAMQPLLDEAHRNPADIASDARFAAAVYKALVASSLCHRRQGNTIASRDAMVELLRSFDIEVSKAQYGAEAQELFARTRTEVKAAPSGAISVRSLDDNAAIFINERFARVGQVSRADMIPGRYRVFAQVGRLQSRVHLVDIKPGDNVTLELDAELEQSIVTSAQWAGLVFAGREQRAQREVSYSSRVGHLMGADAVIVVGLDKREGRSIAYGVRIDVARGKELRRGSIAIEPPASPELQRSLARFLLGDPPAEGISVLGMNPPLSVRSPETQSAPSRHWPGWKWTMTGAAIAGLGAGGVLLVLDGTCTKAPPSGMKCPDLRDYNLAGIFSLSAGAALGVAATWLFFEERRGGGSAFLLAPSDDGAVVGMQGRW